MAQSNSANGYFHMVLVGNLAADPELRYTPGGTAVCNFRIAVNQRVPAGNDEWEVVPQWFKVACWGKQGEACNQYLKKGSRVLVDVSRMNFDKLTGAPELFQRQDGTNGANYEVTAQTVRFLDSRPADQPGEPMVEETIDFN